MLDLTALFQKYKLIENEENNPQVKIQKAFYKLSVAQIKEYIRSGFYPSSLPGKLYDAVATECVDKIHLFKPKYVKFSDLIQVIFLFEDLTKYKNVIKYYKFNLCRTNNLKVLKLCEPYLNACVSPICDDYSINTLTGLELMRVMAKYPNLQKAVYKGRSLDVCVLKEMYYRYDVIPINKGVVYLQKEDSKFLADVILKINNKNELLYVLSESSTVSLNTEEVRCAVLKKIHKGKYLNELSYYVKHYYIDVADLGPYYNIFFGETQVITEYVLNDVFLEAVCNYMDSFTKSTDIIIKTLIDNSNYDLLSQVIKYVPKKYVSENFYMNVIKRSKYKAKILDLDTEYLSECLLIICHIKNYDDVIDFFANNNITTMSFVTHKINPFTNYAFTTSWFNARNDVLALYSSFYYLDPVMMRKIVFEYPLTASSFEVLLLSVTRLYNLSVPHSAINYKSTCIKPSHLPGMFTVQTVPFPIITDACLMFSSNREYCFKVVSQILKYNILKSVKIEKLYYFEKNGKSHLCFNISKQCNINSDTFRLLLQIEELGVLAKHGFFCFMKKYLGNWVPFLNASKLYTHCKYNGPKNITSWNIYSINLKKFVKYEDLSVLFSKKYGISELIDKRTVSYYCLYSYLFVYVFIGAVVYSEDPREYILNIIHAFFNGLGQQPPCVDVSTSLVKEIRTVCNISVDKREDIKPTFSLDLCHKLCSYISKNGNSEPRLPNS